MPQAIHRRTFLAASCAAVALPGAVARAALPVAPGRRARAVRFAVIADLHHGLAPDALDRLRVFVDAVNARDDLDFALQMGDFCHAGREPAPCLELWNSIDPPKLHILGNHDMDTCTKEQAMSAWGMPARYGAREFGGWRFITLDLNNIRDGVTSNPYAHANFYIDGAKRAWADPEQLAWLRETLADEKPTIVLSHQPIGLWEPGADAPPQQREILDILAPGGRPVAGLAACLCGHLHIDRLERHAGIPCWCVNSASYHWHEGMVPYDRALFAFVTLDPAGRMTVEGVEGEWAQPGDKRPGLPDRAWIRPGIADRDEALAVRV